MMFEHTSEVGDIAISTILETPFFQLNYETKARDNIKQELESLKARITD